VSQVVTIVKHELSRIYSIAVFYSPLCGNKTRYCRIEFFLHFFVQYRGSANVSARSSQDKKLLVKMVKANGLVSKDFSSGRLRQMPICCSKLKWVPFKFLLSPNYCGFGAFRAIVNKKQCEARRLFMLLVIP